MSAGVSFVVTRNPCTRVHAAARRAEHPAPPPLVCKLPRQLLSQAGQEVYSTVRELQVDCNCHKASRVCTLWVCAASAWLCQFWLLASNSVPSSRVCPLWVPPIGTVVVSVSPLCNKHQTRPNLAHTAVQHVPAVHAHTTPNTHAHAHAHAQHPRLGQRWAPSFTGTVTRRT